MNYIAHRNSETGKEQSVMEHLENTAKRACAFAEIFGAGESGYFCGMLHDIGKYSDKFQSRIRGGTEKVDHSTAGALEAYDLRHIPAAFCIAGHHGGLPDGGRKKGETPDSPTFFGKMNRVAGKDIEEYSAFRSEVKIEKSEIPAAFIGDRQSAFFFTRMLYSCLVDADYLDTEEFVLNGAVGRETGENLAVLAKKLSSYISKWDGSPKELDQKRCEILHGAMDQSRSKKGLFTLTVPTGGGKTVTSMAFALRHALENGLNRVIYVIPYTSIIEQTQAVFEDIFGAANVIAHYANVDYRTDENGETEDKRYLAAENWDAPIILTTTVQFFESLYANRPSRCRKLHNIVNSVIIFDETQMLPIPYLKPCVSAIAQLLEHYGCSAVLCTATQPALNQLFQEYCPGFILRELCPDVSGMYEFFRRVTFQKAGRLSDRELASRLSGERQVLCIVNNRRQAQNVFFMLDRDGSYHLSTTMYPLHRRSVIQDIRQRLQEGAPCRVVSTSLIEAGVDVDFPTVYRSFAGLDSMIQAGGRCNREGKRRREESSVFLFESDRKQPEIILQNISAAEHVMRKYHDISEPDAVAEYFRFLYYGLKAEEALDAQGIQSAIEKSLMPFATVAERFRIIEGPDFTVYIPLGEGAELCERLKKYGPDKSLMRKLGQYTVGVYPEHFRRLADSCAVERVTGDTAVLRDLSLYSENTGLAFQGSEGMEFII